MSDDLSSVLEVKPPLIARIPVVLDSPHSGTVYPADFQPQVSMEEVRPGEDSFVDELFPGPEYGAPMLAAKFPRVYIDPNRAMDDISSEHIDGEYPGPTNPSAKTDLGIGLIWTRSISRQLLYAQPLSAQAVEHRVNTYWKPYRQRLRELIDDTYASHGVVMHINCHSMPSHWPEGFDRAGEPIGVDFVLGNRDHTTCSEETANVARRSLESCGYAVAINDQMKGVDIVREQGRPNEGRHSLQIEVVRDRYMDESTWSKSDGFEGVQKALGVAIDALAAHVVELRDR